MILGCGGDLDAEGFLRLSSEGRSAPTVVLSHDSAAALLGIGRQPASGFDVSTALTSHRRVPGARLHRRPSLAPHALGYREGIPVTSPVQTLIDLATRHGGAPMERLINEADRLRLVRTDDLRKALDDHPGDPGVARLRSIIDRATFRYTRSELEWAFLPLVRAAGLPTPRTSVYVSGYEVDFYFPELDLVVETDGLTYHRTPAEQAKDRERDQAHTAAGLVQLRFTHGQIKYEPDHVLRTLHATAAWLPRRTGAIIPS